MSIHVFIKVNIKQMKVEFAISSADMFVTASPSKYPFFFIFTQPHQKRKNLYTVL